MLRTPKEAADPEQRRHIGKKYQFVVAVQIEVLNAVVLAAAAVAAAAAVVGREVRRPDY